MRRYLLLLVVLCFGGAAAAQSAAEDLHLKKLNAADQARAKSMLVRKSDLPAWFRSGRFNLVPNDDSPNPFCTLSAPQLVITGEAATPDFDRPDGFVSSVGQVYETLDDADASWLFGTSASGEKCTRDDIALGTQKAGASVVAAFHRVAFPRLAQQSVAYRAVLSRSGVRVYSDMVMMQNSRAHAWLVFLRVGAPLSRSFRLRLARRVAARMNSAMKNDPNLR